MNELCPAASRYHATSHANCRELTLANESKGRAGTFCWQRLRPPTILFSTTALSHSFSLYHIMTRATETFTALGVATVIYIALFFGALPLPQVIQDKIIPVVR